jgi:hypothetical protein
MLVRGFCKECMRVAVERAKAHNLARIPCGPQVYEKMVRPYRDIEPRGMPFGPGHWGIDMVRSFEQGVEALWRPDAMPRGRKSDWSTCQIESAWIPSVAGGDGQNS